MEWFWFCWTLSMIGAIVYTVLWAWNRDVVTGWLSLAAFYLAAVVITHVACWMAAYLSESSEWFGWHPCPCPDELCDPTRRPRRTLERDFERDKRR